MGGLQAVVDDAPALADRDSEGAGIGIAQSCAVAA